MVIDTSALIAILQDEPERRALSESILMAQTLSLSAASLVEAGVVIQGRYGDDGATRLNRLLVQIGAETVPVSVAQVETAREAFRRFGKGCHPAGLNVGDCFSYALAVALGEPLLFVGQDFGQTDILVT